MVLIILESGPGEAEDIHFSNESRFQTYANISRLVRRPRNSRYSRKYVVQTIKYGSSLIMVWEARVLVRCTKRLNFIGYQYVSESELFKLCGPQSVFAQDNAPCHKSRSTLTYLDNKQVWLLADWPPRSPNINIIENL